MAMIALAAAREQAISDLIRLIRRCKTCGKPHENRLVEYRRAIRAWVDAGMPSETSTRADERARVLAEVQAALRDRDFYHCRGCDDDNPVECGIAGIADYLRDTLGAGG